MKTKLLLAFSVLTLVISLILMTVGVASGDGGSQTWYLHSPGHPEGDTTYIMEKGVIQTDAKDKAIHPGKSLFWLSQNAAVSDVTFPDGQWEINLHICSDWTAYLTVEVGEWDSVGDNFILFSTSVASMTYSGGPPPTVNVKLDSSASNTVHAGNYLALEIKNDDSVDNDVYTDQYGWLKSPPSDPGFPLPELATGVLLTAGLAVLVGYIVIRKRRATAKK